MTAGLALSCGVDVVSVSALTRAIEHVGPRMLEVCFTPAEIASTPGTEGLAARFAAKEATAKALGTGLLRGIGFQDIEILSDVAGKPMLHLHGPAAREAAAKGLNEWSVSLTHELDLAVALVVATGSVEGRVQRAGGENDGREARSAE